MPDEAAGVPPGTDPATAPDPCTAPDSGTVPGTAPDSGTVPGPAPDPDMVPATVPAAAPDPRLLGPADIRQIAGRLGLRPAKRLGQNFVIDAGTVRRITALARLDAADVV